MVSLRIQKRLEASVMKCRLQKGQSMARPKRESSDISMASSQRNDLPRVLEETYLPPHCLPKAHRSQRKGLRMRRIVFFLVVIFLAVIFAWIL